LAESDFFQRCNQKPFFFCPTPEKGIFIAFFCFCNQHKLNNDQEQNER